MTWGQAFEQIAAQRPLTSDERVAAWFVHLEDALDELAAHERRAWGEANGLLGFGS